MARRRASAIREFFRWLRLVLSGRGAASAPHYHHFRKIILPTPRGSCEIDHLIVSPFGLFVIENKDRSGWIFGEESARNWTAVHFTTKYAFQNPLHQELRPCEGSGGIAGHRRDEDARGGSLPRQL